MVVPVVSSVDEAYWNVVRSLDREGAWQIATTLVDEDRSGEVLSAVRATQRRVGEEWLADRMSIAEEHVATAINDAVLGIVESRIEPQSATRGTVGVFCVEHEWHSMPARLFALDLRAEGWKVVFFGASLPTESLAPLVATTAFDGLAVSCTLSTHLVAVRDLTDQLAGRSAPIVGGGAGFGPNGCWAAAAGIEAFAADASAASSILDEWTRDGRRSAASPRAQPVERLASNPATIIDASMACLGLERSTIADGLDRPVRMTREDLQHVLEYLDAAELADDDALFTDFVDWRQEMMTSRGAPATALAIALRSLADSIEDAPARRRLAVALRRLGST